MDELELSKQCLQGINLAREELYKQYSGRLFSLCLRYTGSREEAQDLLQDGFLKIFRSFDKFTWRGKGSLRAWMEKVMVNVALQAIRKDKAMGYSISLDEIPETSFDQEVEEPDEADVDAISESELLQYISELPVGYRTVFNLYIFEEKSHKEIAQILGINEKSSSSQLLRARRLLAKRIAARGEKISDESEG
ncbi:MAG: sigma-70 family RNA polymerase sigma factor [Bacteroidaceae bacterium]|nr:sigma-70 family RNA polymerase sigma factor [Bacteroidaceae bacterium]